MKVIGLLGYAFDEKNEFVGVKQVGKDTVASYIKDMWHGPCMLVSFADALKNVVCEVYNLDRSYYDTPEHKEEPIPHLNHWSFRDLLIHFGDIVREHVDINYFSNIVKDKIQNYMNSEPNNLMEYVLDLQQLIKQKTPDSCIQLRQQVDQMPQPYEPIIVVTDVRYPNEYKCLEELSCQFVQIRKKRVHEHKHNNHNNMNNNSNQEELHKSNMYYECMQPHYVLDNDGDLEDLRVKVKNFLTSLTNKMID